MIMIHLLPNFNFARSWVLIKSKQKNWYKTPIQKIENMKPCLRDQCHPCILKKVQTLFVPNLFLDFDSMLALAVPVFPCGEISDTVWLEYRLSSPPLCILRLWICKLWSELKSQIKCMLLSESKTNKNFIYLDQNSLHNLSKDLLYIAFLQFAATNL